MRAYGKSDIGKVRKTNEDSYLCSPPAIFIVADGMGGHAAGEVASSLAVRTVAEHLAKSALPDIKEAIGEAVSAANQLIWQTASERPEYFGMGTTLTVVYLDGDNVFWGHIGDSRLYILTEGRLSQITDDHSVVWELVKKGTITEDESKSHSKRNMLTRALGTERQVKIDTGSRVWQKNDKLLLCSDGLTNMMAEDEILKIINTQDEPENIELMVNELIAQANFAGGGDNITAVLLMNN